MIATFRRSSQPLRECTDPPIILPFPEAVDEEELSPLIDNYRERIREAGFSVEFCDHLSEREQLYWIFQILQNDIPTDDSTQDNLFLDPETCAGCIRESVDDREDEPLATAGDEIAQTRNKIVRVQQDVEDYMDSNGGLAWPPGVQRVIQLVETVLDRLEADIEQEETGLLEGSTDAAYGIITGMEPLNWLLEGISLITREDHYRAHESLAGANRIIRGLAQLPPDDHPGRLYRDLGYLIPDGELYAQLSLNAWEEADGRFPDPPERTATDPDPWRDFYLSMEFVEDPLMREIFERDYTVEELENLRRSWKHRQLNWLNQNKRHDWFNKQVLTGSMSFDPDLPHKFFEREQPFLDSVKQRLEEMDSDEIGLAVILSQVNKKLEAGPPPDPPEEIPEDEELMGLPLYDELTRLSEQLKPHFQVETHQEVEPLIVALNFLVVLAMEWLDRHRVYIELCDNDAFEQGAYRVIADAAREALRWIDHTHEGSHPLQSQFETIHERAQSLGRAEPS